MSQQSAIELGKIKARFQRMPLPAKFSRIVSVLLGYVNKENDVAWPSRKLLASAVGCSEKTVQRNLAAVRRIGIFTVETIGGEEARHRLRLKRATDRHLYTLYTLNRKHPLWSGDKEEIQRAKAVIKGLTWRGIAERTARRLADEVGQGDIGNDFHSLLMNVESLANGDGSGLLNGDGHDFIQ